MVEVGFVCQSRHFVLLEQFLGIIQEGRTG